MNRARLALIVLLCLAGAVFAQRRFRDPRQFQDSDTPKWTNAPGFEKDVFTFVRIRYSEGGGRGFFGGRGRGGGWSTDWPDAELNFSYRLQQMTSLKVNPQPVDMELTDPQLFRYPFIYIVEPGDLAFTDDEVKILRQYLLNGGFLMVDDFWGVDEWENFEYEIKRVFKDREMFDVPRTHAIFSMVFPLPPDLNLQLPSIGWGWGGAREVTWERNKRYDGDTDAHFRGFNDDKGRLCVMICHNTDNGDGWEREGENVEYFREFSEKKAYPLGINIVVYAMTH